MTQVTTTTTITVVRRQTPRGRHGVRMWSAVCDTRTELQRLQGPWSLLNEIRYALDLSRDVDLSGPRPSARNVCRVVVSFTHCSQPSSLQHDSSWRSLATDVSKNIMLMSLAHVLPVS